MCAVYMSKDLTQDFTVLIVLNISSRDDSRHTNNYKAYIYSTYIIYIENVAK